MITLSGALLVAVTLAGCSKTKIVDPKPGHAPLPDRHTEAMLQQEKNPVDPVAMTAAHNHWRSRVGVPELKWSDALVDVAQHWADTLKKDGCGFYHSLNGYGENLFMASPLMWSDGGKELQETSPQKVTGSWGDEVKDYNYSDNSCSGVCGHYTQVVWKETAEVGCARSVCDDKSQIWVCSYSPAGNTAGKKPY